MLADYRWCSRYLIGWVKAIYRRYARLAEAAICIISLVRGSALVLFK